MAQTFENLEKYQGCSQEMLEQAVHQATDIVKGNLKDFTDFFQSPNTEKWILLADRKCRMDHRFLDRCGMAGL